MDMSIALGEISLLFLPLLVSPPPNLSIRRSDHVLEARRSDRGRVVDGLNIEKEGTFLLLLALLISFA